MMTSVFKQTRDDWFPPFVTSVYGEEMMLVEVSFLPISFSDDWRVCAWGARAIFGFEKDFSSKEEAWKCFTDIVQMEWVNVRDLINLGFKRAYR